MLHASAVCDRVDVADQIFRSTDSEDRDSVISCVYDDGETPLHKAKSSAMAQALLDALTPETKQRFIKRKDTVGMTAALSALIKEKRDVFNTIWTQSDLSTQLYLLQSHISNSGQSLLMWVSWSGDKGIVRRLLTCIQTPDSWEEIITAVSGQGTTATHQLILHRNLHSETVSTSNIGEETRTPYCKD